MSSQDDHYNWKFPNKKDTMYLNKIDGPKILNKYHQTNFQQSPYSKPKLKPYQYTNKQSFVNRNDDIEKSKSKVLTYQRNAPDYQLYCRDIKGTTPMVNKFQTNRPPSNPLEPEYNLPKYQLFQPFEPKFIRDNIDVSVNKYNQDIVGTQSKITFYMRLRAQDKFIIPQEIKGTRPKTSKIMKKNNYMFDVDDICKEGLFKSQRQTDPLDPIVIIYKEYNINKQTHGQIEKSKCKKKCQNEKNTFSLKSYDIEGCLPNSAYQKIYRINTRDRLLKTKDIQGATVNTRKVGLDTKRKTNPLKPRYQYLGSKQNVIPARPLSAVQHFDKYISR